METCKRFFNPSPVASAALTVRGIGVQERMPPGINDRPRGTGDCLLMFFYDAVRIGAGATPRLYPPYQLMIWPTGQPQYYGNRERPYNHTWIHAKGSELSRWLRQTRLAVGAPFTVADPAAMERALLAVYAEMTEEPEPDATIVGNLIENWLRQTARARRQPVKARPPRVFLEARRRLETACAEPIRLAELARHAGLSASHFCVRFRQWFGASPIDYLIRHRLHQAAYLLQDRNLSVKEVAARVGYGDLFYFSKLFKKHYGVSPRGYRATRC
ncbi:MAG: helix-turn-helix transcriptional regulator [Kiritimatiellae bacterium]|nr:helix-turn-helix transcriptional regulator [Kiritimatiellia bacterium]